MFLLSAVRQFLVLWFIHRLKVVSGARLDNRESCNPKSWYEVVSKVQNEIYHKLIKIHCSDDMLQVWRIMGSTQISKLWNPTENQSIGFFEGRYMTILEKVVTLTESLHGRPSCKSQKSEHWHMFISQRFLTWSALAIFRVQRLQ